MGRTSNNNRTKLASKPPISAKKGVSKRVVTTVVPRQPVRQPYTRFNVSLCRHDVTVEEAKKNLIEKIGGTAKTYQGNLSGLAAYVNARRGAHDQDLLTCTEEEFILFLYERKQQGQAGARGVWSALKNLFLQNGVKTSFLDDKDVKKAVEGASANFYPVNKGVINDAQDNMLNSFIEECPDEQLGRCTWCRVKGTKDLRRKIRLAKDLMKGVALRPGNLKDLEKLDVIENHRPPLLHIRNPKVKGKDKEVITSEGLKAWKEACRLADNEKVFPRCIDTHLTAVLRGAEVTYGWDQGLVFSVHCLKHTCITKLEQKVEDSKKNFLCGVGTSTRKNHYGKAIEKRRKVQD